MLLMLTIIPTKTINMFVDNIKRIWFCGQVNFNQIKKKSEVNTLHHAFMAEVPDGTKCFLSYVLKKYTSAVHSSISPNTVKSQ